MKTIRRTVKVWVLPIILVLILSAFTINKAALMNEPTDHTVSDIAGAGKPLLEHDDIQHITVPADTLPEGITKDEVDTSLTESRKMANGDSLRLGILERPFSQTEMVYHPETDLLNISVSADDDFYYFAIELSGIDEQSGYPSANYAIEFDTDMDLKGDFLLWAQGDDSMEWNTDNVMVLQDANGDVGGSTAVIPDPGAGDGYEAVLFSTDVMDDPDMAWKRVDPAMPNIVQLAIKKSILDNAYFYWKSWADGGVADPSMFDYNDAFSSSQAGSPDLTSVDYPVNEVNLVDSTCWSAFGFQPTQEKAGGCYKAPVKIKPKKSTPPTPVPVPI